jgi:hydrogenase maturation protease
VSDPRVLVAGIGNVFLGDDAFGVEVAQELLRGDDLGPGVTLREYGIRGFDLAYEILSGYDAVVLVDAVSRGESPGTVSIIEADVEGVPERSDYQGHSMTPEVVLSLVRTMGARPPRTLVVGCEPESFGDGDGGRMGLSEVVPAAIPAALHTVRILAGDLRCATSTTEAARA